MIKQTAICHIAAPPWQYVDSDNTLYLTVRAEAGAVDFMTCFACDPCDTQKSPQGQDIPNLSEFTVTLELSSCGWDYYTLKIPMSTHKLRYHFLLRSKSGENLVLDSSGIMENKDEIFIRPFFVTYTYPKLYHSAPEWASDMIWYQIFPDRFAGHGERVAKPVVNKDTVYGGTLTGIMAKVPYLKKLGITGIYLNPIFQAESIHRYDIVDYFKIDPKLGTEADLIELCDICHDCGIKVMLDGVYNHCSYKSALFQDVMELGHESKYYDWFLVHDEDRMMAMDRKHIDATDFRKAAPYETFAFVPSMPKFNTENPKVMDFLISSAEYWTKKCHIDAWRLDVPDEVNVRFLRQFRSRLKLVNPDIYLIGEYWSDATPWLNGELFDGAMNYPLYFIIRDFLALGHGDAYSCADSLARCLMEHPAPVRKGMFNFCSTHDVPRILWHCHEDKNLMGLCYILTAVLDGGMSVYYGDEVGMTGGYDPDNRRCFPIKTNLPNPLILEAIKLKKSTATHGLHKITALDKDILCLYFENSHLLVNRSEEEKLCGYRVKLAPKSYALVPQID